jgi:hypothetical protein
MALMRVLVLGCSLLLLAGSGCVHRKSPAAPAQFGSIPGVTDTAPTMTTASPAPKNQPVVTPDGAVVGKVKSVNPTARFVILSFPLGRLPAADQQFSVYRRGQKVGDIKITSQRLNDLIVADIIEGDAEEGDDVRNR